jgi:hypothetical protein
MREQQRKPHTCRNFRTVIDRGQAGLTLILGRCAIIRSPRAKGYPVD